VTPLARLLAAAFVIAAISAAAAQPQAEPPAPSCTAPPSLTVIERPLTQVASRIEQHQLLTIVAVGSSSTQGVGASAPAFSYPRRLEAELKDRFPGTEIRVVNRGKGGQDVGEELARLGAEVISEKPDLVIWQVGTNAVLRRDDLVLDGDLIRQGVDLLRPSGADIVLMDLQYAPRVLDRPAYAEMERLIANAAKEERVGLFRRFEVMRWQAAQPDAPAMVGADGLHMNDRGYGCLAAELADSLASNWRLQQRSVERREEPAALAGHSTISGHTAGTPAPQ
jgi:lysophospholipase L1-like esterase